MPVRFHPSNPINSLETIITKEDGTPLHGEIDIYRKLFYDLENSELDWDIWHKYVEYDGYFIHIQARYNLLLFIQCFQFQSVVNLLYTPLTYSPFVLFSRYKQKANPQIGIVVDVGYFI